MAAAAAAGRGHHRLGRRDGYRGRASGHNRPHFLVLSAHPGTHAGPVSSLMALSGDGPEEPVGVASQLMPMTSSSRDESSRQISVEANPISSSTTGAPVLATMNRQEIASTNQSV